MFVLLFSQLFRVLSVFTEIMDKWLPCILPVPHPSFIIEIFACFCCWLLRFIWVIESSCNVQPMNGFLLIVDSYLLSDAPKFFCVLHAMPLECERGNGGTGDGGLKPATTSTAATATRRCSTLLTRHACMFSWVLVLRWTGVDTILLTYFSVFSKQIAFGKKFRHSSFE